MTNKTEEAVLQAAYYWSFNPTDREAKRLLFAAVRKDMDAEEKRDQRRLYRAEQKEKKNATSSK
jgi:hypothetical protein